jgi:peptidoglycan/LPS O-acetylase OafA/YrhL
MLALRLQQRRSRSRAAADTAVHASARAADVGSVRAIFILALAARGLIEIINALGHPWAQLTRTLLLAAFALGLFTVAQRSHDRRSGWLLSGAVAVGLAIASLYDFMAVASAPAVRPAALVVCVVLVLFITCGTARRRRH